MFSLKHSIKFYVPSTAENGRAISDRRFAARALVIRRLFSLLFGGSTSTRAIGDYIANDNRLISERILIVSAYSDRASLVKHYDKVFYLARLHVKHWQQETIGISINRTFYVIDYDQFILPGLIDLKLTNRDRLVSYLKGWFAR